MHNFIFNNSEKLTNFNNFQYVTFRRNQTSEKYELAHLTYNKLLPHCIGKCKKVIFQQYSAVISSKQLFLQTVP